MSLAPGERQALALLAAVSQTHRRCQPRPGWSRPGRPRAGPGQPVRLQPVPSHVRRRGGLLAFRPLGTARQIPVDTRLRARAFISVGRMKLAHA